MTRYTDVAVNRNNTIKTPKSPAFFCVGNLVKNGRFEPGLAHWIRRNVRPVSGKETHEGRGAAGLGARRRNRKKAWIYQYVPLPRVSSPLFLQLFFSVAGFRDAPAALYVTLSWLDKKYRLLGHGIQAHIQRRAIGNGSRGRWNAYSFVSDQVPAEAEIALLRFYKPAGPSKSNALVIDDVVLTSIVGSCFARLPCKTDSKQ